MDLNRLNGVDIDDYIIEFEDNQKQNYNVEEQHAKKLFVELR